MLNTSVRMECAVHLDRTNYAVYQSLHSVLFVPINVSSKINLSNIVWTKGQCVLVKKYIFMHFKYHVSSSL